MKKLFQIILWVLVLSGISVILSFAMIEQRAVKCTALSVCLSDGNPYGFISTKEIKKLVYQEFDSIKGKPVNSLDIELLERKLEMNPYIRCVKVYTTIHGGLTVEVDREKALVRIVNKKNESFYLSRLGRPLPITENYTPHVTVAIGNINESYMDLIGMETILVPMSTGKNSVLVQLVQVVKALVEDPYLNNHVKQIYINREGEIELIPDHGQFVILLGNVADLEIKFENLLTFYQAGLPKLGAENVSVVNLKYKNQVVCQK